MPELVCNTSPLQYLHQLGLLELLPRLASRVLVPQAVADELSVGLSAGLDLPKLEHFGWITVRVPSSAAVLPIAVDLGRGESQVLALAIETPGTVAVLDDAHARRVAKSLGLPLTGVLGLLLDFKAAKLIADVMTSLDRLDALRFRVSSKTRAAVLRLASESD